MLAVMNLHHISTHGWLHSIISVSQLRQSGATSSLFRLSFNQAKNLTDQWVNFTSRSISLFCYNDIVDEISRFLNSITFVLEIVPFVFSDSFQRNAGEFDMFLFEDFNLTFCLMS